MGRSISREILKALNARSSNGGQILSLHYETLIERDDISNVLEFLEETKQSFNKTLEDMIWNCKSILSRRHGQR